MKHMCLSVALVFLLVFTISCGKKQEQAAETAPVEKETLAKKTASAEEKVVEGKTEAEATEETPEHKGDKVSYKLDGRVDGLESYDQGVKIVYKFDIVGIAASALAYKGDLLIAKAEKVGMRQTVANCLDIEVEETHFSQSGAVTYKGKMLFRFKEGTGRGERIEVKLISGERHQDLFREWPYGSRMPMGFH